MFKLRFLAISGVAALALSIATPSLACDSGCDDPAPSKGNNGWGNGDQPAPGNSGNSNAAENNGQGRSHGVHGDPNQN